MSDLIYSIRHIFGSDDPTGCLQQSGCSAFWIPAYQRGYKWGADGEEKSSQPVDQLLSDLKAASKKGAKEYLLQAITVKKVKSETGGDVLEVIDGQQRLTTLFILLHALDCRLGTPTGSNLAAGKLLYSIRHKETSLDDLVAKWLNVEMPPETELFTHWEAFRRAGDKEHQDLAYLERAALRCHYEFRIDTGNEDFKDRDNVRSYQTYLLEQVKLLVNRVEPHVQGEAIFAALNSNRVELTECELIKGVLLTRVARSPSEGRERRYREILERRIQLGRKWDEIQHWASREDIRSFYFAAANDEASNQGMMRMLELAVRQTQKDHKHPKSDKANLRHPLFNHIFELDDQCIILDLLISTYARLRDWYETDESYHLIGYCLTNKTNTADRIFLLAQLLDHKTKTEARKGLFKLRRVMLLGEFKTLQVDQLSYTDHAKQLQNIFLAVSVFFGDKHSRFNFLAYAKEKWSLEHIFPQTPFGKGAVLTEAQKTAALDLIQSSNDLLGVGITQQIANLRKGSDQEDLKANVEKVLNEALILHRAGNLCLLSSQDNTAMGCGMFDEKRIAIQKRIARGSFVPRHTYEVFSKMIVNNDGDLTVWTMSDIDLHAKRIESQIAELIKPTMIEVEA